MNYREACRIQACDGILLSQESLRLDETLVIRKIICDLAPAVQPGTVSVARTQLDICG